MCVYQIFVHKRVSHNAASHLVCTGSPFAIVAHSACMRDALIVCVHDSGVMSLLA